MPTTTDAGVIQRHFTTAGVDPLDQVEWSKRPAWKEGDPHYRPEVEAPADWSQSSVDITAKLYLAKGEYCEDSVRALIERVVDKITREGIKAGYFDRDENKVLDENHAATIFNAELKAIMVGQRACFNSPVLFNIGRPDRIQQVSACYILGVGDTTDSIMETAQREAMIFKGGSGSGYSVSDLRGSMEPLLTGGISSGPVSFMRMWNAVGGTFKSGGTTRRCARLVRMDADHPDIRDFITCKVREEDRLRALKEHGEDISLGMIGERNVEEITSFQNANNSAGISDDFMRRATDGPSEWNLIARKKGAFEDDVVVTDDASEILDLIAQSAWACADPGVQFDTIINSWHTTPSYGRIRASNACSEYLSNDDTSCNLASINVLEFVKEDWSFDVESYQHVVDVMVVAMDILVGFSEFPNDDQKLRERTRALRQLGLGYTNMGAAIMAQGLPYDSDRARDFAAAVTALTTGRAYRRSALLAQELGPFDGFEDNRDPMLGVIDQHYDHLPLDDTLVGSIPTHAVWFAAERDWRDAKEEGREYGFRNAQTTVIAPTGSISFFMGADTTGIEPAFSLVTYKDLAGGGQMKLVSKSVERAASALGGYSKEDLLQMADGDFSSISDEDRAVFAGANDISPEGHVKMVAAVQPWLSGGVSKSINVTGATSWEEIRDLYVLAWRLGVKCMSVYRDRSKARQVLSSAPKESAVEIAHGPDREPSDTPPRWREGQQYQGGPRPQGVHTDEIRVHADEIELLLADAPHAEDAMEGPVGPERRRMPRDRESLIHKMNCGGFEGYLIVGKYEDGTPGEIFIEDIGKEGSTLRGMMNAWAIQVSTSLQYGQPLEVMVRKYTNMCFEPNGRTECLEIPTAQSLPDYIMRWMALKFLPHMHEELGILTLAEKQRRTTELDMRDSITAALVGGRTPLDPSQLVPSNGNGRVTMSDQMCQECGGLLQRAGSCLTCSKCGASTGCG